LAAVRFFSVLFAALAFAPAAAHLLELPNKIGLSREDYFVAQQLYRGWALLALVVLPALALALLHAIMVRGQRASFRLAALAFCCLLGTQVLFWTFTFPANQLTENWTLVPDNWAALREQWEYSHAASALLNLVALVALIASVVVHEK
jgi:hypothetical protein